MTTVEKRVERLEQNDVATHETLKDLQEGQRALQDAMNEQFGDVRADIKDLQNGQRRLERKVDGLERKVDDVKDDVRELKMGMRMVIDRLNAIDKRLP